MTARVASETSTGAHPSRVRDLHPGWFAAVMGTAILAVATRGNPGNLVATSGAAHVLGAGLAGLAYALGALLAAAYAIRWIRHTHVAMTDLRHPVLGALHATVPGGLLVLAVMTSVVGPDIVSTRTVVALTTVLAVAGGVLAIVVSLAFTSVLFTGEPPVSAVNGGGFIPPVVMGILAMALATLVPHAGPGTARLLLVIGYAAYGMRFLLFLLVMGMLYGRLVLHPLPAAPLAPTLWIALGPVGVSVLAPLALARADEEIFGGAAAAITVVSQLVGTGGWGFGLWWLAISISLLVRYVRAGGVPFQLGWWAFTFPLGAFTVATMTLARAWALPAPLGLLAAGLYLALLGCWTVVATKTVAATRSGRVWQR